MSDKQLKQRTIIVLGAGVIGLTTAHVLSEDPANNITVVARELPGEHMFSQGWASPWAGANWSPMATYVAGARNWKWEKTTFETFWSMIPSGMTMELPCRVYWDSDSIEKFSAEPAWKDIPRDFRVIPQNELPEGYAAGVAYTTLSVKPGTYLPWLEAQVKARDVAFLHRVVGSIEEAAAIGGPDCIVINATGMGARTLLGVADPDAIPIRGQTLFVDAPRAKVCFAATTRDAIAYVIPRPDGTVTLGGTFQEGNADLTVDLDTARAIYERCTALVPELKVENGAKIISHNVGLRPGRRGGPRVELETVQLPLEDMLVPDYGLPRPHRELKVVHAYGLGGAGYQSSWGVAEDVANIISKL